MTTTLTIVAFGIAHAVAGALLTAAVFKLIEQSELPTQYIVAGLVTGPVLFHLLALAAFPWEVTWSVTSSGLLACIVGMGIVALLFEPEPDSEASRIVEELNR